MKQERGIENEKTTIRMKLEVTCKFTRMRPTPQIVLFILCIFSHVMAGDSKKIFALVGQNIDINCDVDFPVKDLLHNIWYKNGVPLASAERSGEVLYYAEIWSSKLTITTNFSLRIFTVKKEDAADYTCKIFTSAKNNFLTYNNTMELVVQDIPDPPGTPVISDLNSRNATVRWHHSVVDNNGPITAYIITVKSGSLENGQVYEVSSKTDYVVLRDLRPNTAYQVWVMARNAVGSSPRSSPSELFFTPPERPSSPPLNLTARSVESDKIEISWQAPPRDTINGILQGYEIQYEIVGENIIIPITIDGSKERVIIQGVQPFTNYKISVRAFNNADKGPASFTFVRTAEGVPEKPRIIHVSNRLPTSFVVNWEAPKKINGILNSYHLQWGHNNTLKTRIINSHLTNPMSELLSGLEPYTRYHLRVAAYTGGGSSEYSDQFTAFTDVAGPEEPNITNYTVIDSHSIYIAWEEPKTFYKSVNRYFIHYWDPKHSNNHGELTVDGNETEKLITGLRTNSVYKLKVAGVTESIFSQSYYVGKFSEPVIFELGGVEPVEAHQIKTISAGALAGILIGVGIIIVTFGLLVCYRISFLRPHQSEDPDHAYAEIEPLRANDVESPSTSSGAVPLPMKKHKRRLGVSMYFGRLFGKDFMHSAANDAIFFSKESESVLARTLPSVPDFLNEDRKGKRRVTQKKIPSAALLEGNSQMSFTSSGVSVEMHERENVYNPLMTTDSIPYEELELGKTGLGAHSITDEGTPGSSNDDGIKGQILRWGENSHRCYKDRLDKDLSPKPTEFENTCIEEDDCTTKLDTINSTSPNETCESKQDHDFFAHETTASSAGSEDSAGQSSQKPFPPQDQMNTEISRASYEEMKNVSNIDDNQTHSDDESLCTTSSLLSHMTHSGIHQMNDNQNYLCTESADNFVNNYVHAAKQINFAEAGHDTDNEDSNITIKKNTSSDDYVEPIKSNTVSEYLEIIPCVP